MMIDDERTLEVWHLNENVSHSLMCLIIGSSVIGSTVWGRLSVVLLEEYITGCGL